MLSSGFILFHVYVLTDNHNLFFSSKFDPPSLAPDADTDVTMKIEKFK